MANIDIHHYPVHKPITLVTMTASNRASVGEGLLSSLGACIAEMRATDDEVTQCARAVRSCGDYFAKNRVAMGLKSFKTLVQTATGVAYVCKHGFFAVPLFVLSQVLVVGRQAIPKNALLHAMSSIDRITSVDGCAAAMVEHGLVETMTQFLTPYLADMHQYTLNVLINVTEQDGEAVLGRVLTDRCDLFLRLQTLLCKPKFPYHATVLFLLRLLINLDKTKKDGDMIEDTTALLNAIMKASAHQIIENTELTFQACKVLVELAKNKKHAEVIMGNAKVMDYIKTVAFSTTNARNSVLAIDVLGTIAISVPKCVEWCEANGIHEVAIQALGSPDELTVHRGLRYLVVSCQAPGVRRAVATGPGIRFLRQILSLPDADEMGLHVLKIFHQIAKNVQERKWLREGYCVPLVISMIKIKDGESLVYALRVIDYLTTDRKVIDQARSNDEALRRIISTLHDQWNILSGSSAHLLLKLTTDCSDEFKHVLVSMGVVPGVRQLLSSPSTGFVRVAMDILNNLTSWENPTVPDEELQAYPCDELVTALIPHMIHPRPSTTQTKSAAVLINLASHNPGGMIRADIGKCLAGVLCSSTSTDSLKNYVRRVIHNLLGPGLCKQDQAYGDQKTTTQNHAAELAGMMNVYFTKLESYNASFVDDPESTDSYGVIDKDSISMLDMTLVLPVKSASSSIVYSEFICDAAIVIARCPFIKNYTTTPSTSQRVRVVLPESLAAGKCAWLGVLRFIYSGTVYLYEDADAISCLARALELTQLSDLCQRSKGATSAGLAQADNHTIADWERDMHVLMNSKDRCADLDIYPTSRDANCRADPPPRKRRKSQASPGSAAAMTAHWVIVNTRCRTLVEQYGCPRDDMGRRRVNFPSSDPKVLQLWLEYIYCGATSTLISKLLSSGDISVVLGLHDVATRTGNCVLKDFCEGIVAGAPLRDPDVYGVLCHFRASRPIAVMFACWLKIFQYCVQRDCTVGVAVRYFISQYLCHATHTGPVVIQTSFDQRVMNDMELLMSRWK